MRQGMVKKLLILAVLVAIAVYLAPIFAKDSLPPWWTQKRLNLGLDLQGGMQMLLEVDTSKLPQKDHANTVNSALEIIRNRIDPEGVKEPSIQIEGTNRILVQLPGERDFERMKKLIEATALLEFKLVAPFEEGNKAFEKLDSYLKTNIEKPKFAYLKEFAEEIGGKNDTDLLAEADSIEVDYYSTVFSDLCSSAGAGRAIAYRYVDLFKKVMNDNEIKRQIPAGLQIALGKKAKENAFSPRSIFILYDKVELTGSYVKSARGERGAGGFMGDNMPHVALEFNKKGAKIFSNVTGKNIKKNLAIVLDDVVYSAPTINDKIPSGKATISGSFTMQEAQDLANIINAGNLPAPIHTGQVQAVGATLGDDSIAAGLKAGLFGLLAVVLFMLVYYKVGGIVANIALAINVGFIIAALTMLGGTLTLPGIVGIILTIGMAVDANVLIFERIREELANNKTPRSAVDQGFGKAMITIIDANITTLITAIVLYQFGTGAIKGFAVTLSLGILGSMFTAIILSKAIFTGIIVSKNSKKLSI